MILIELTSAKNPIAGKRTVHLSANVDCTAAMSATVPLEQATAKAAPLRSATISSSAVTLGPCARAMESSALATDHLSASLIGGCLMYGI